tara:strand:- start:219 stop:383 length:165 start_codon:yes stop_codon:yes gene_type:complete
MENEYELQKKEEDIAEILRTKDWLDGMGLDSTLRIEYKPSNRYLPVKKENEGKD